MKDQAGSKKRELISKSNSKMLVMIGVAGAVFGFSLVASFTLIRQMNYKSKVISKRQAAADQLNKNVESVEEIVTSYEAFNSASESVLGNDTKNSRIVLDALPSQYDFPALALSLEKILVASGLSEISIGGTDNEASAEQESTSPQPIELSVTLGGQGDYLKAQELIKNLERSIRPIKITSLTFSGDQSELSVSVSGITYYQPKKILEIRKEEVQ